MHKHIPTIKEKKMGFDELKYNARRALSGNWLIAIIAAIIAGLLGASVLNNATASYDYSYEDFEESEDVENDITSMIPDEALVFIGAVVTVFAIAGLIYAIIMFTIGSGVSIGYCRFNMDLIDGIRPSIGTLFSAFGQIKTAIAVRLLTGVLVGIGYIFLIVPGIILSYSYSMATFIMADNPYLTTTEVLKESRMLMKGNKLRLFCLNLSFIGYILLCILTFGIGFIWLTPYMNATYAAFYRQIKQNANIVV